MFCQIGPGPYPQLTDECGSRILDNFLWVTLTTDDPEKLPIPSPLLLSIHSRLSTSVRWTHIEDQVRAGWPQSSWTLPRVPQHLSLQIFQFIRASWLTIPRFIRIPLSMMLLYAGKKLYPSYDPGIQRLPFGLYVKYGRFGHAKDVKPHEAEGLTLLENHTDVPVPRLLNFFEYRENLYLFMTRIYGQPVQNTFHLMTYKEWERLVDELRHCISQFRQIPNGRAHCRFNDNVRGNFESVRDFNGSLVTRQNLASVVEAAHSKEQRVYFTHGDFSSMNILTHNGRFAGIVDFECSGFLPEYWEYTMAMFDFWATQKPWGALVDSVFEGFDYREELEAERELWRNRNSF
ncbi:hypothetical protein AJ79_03694 [Helicocarpus griseus UAMH5409]|uniref:Aminoglycoside phosphotransferase domain-containing protein n=1 Tax=Helicocarpus griseus UAMH5409 TaxID=1447875 RepID=A0A2B7XWU1_9EURO|nr:hypothetical protein AJ79_03694 [Helicocarpus griseus UAMH5409]